jgi:hypothetical protein
MGSDNDKSQRAGALEMDGKLAGQAAGRAFRQKPGDHSVAFGADEKGLGGLF